MRHSPVQPHHPSLPSSLRVLAAALMLAGVAAHSPLAWAADAHAAPAKADKTKAAEAPAEVAKPAAKADAKADAHGAKPAPEAKAAPGHEAKAAPEAPAAKAAKAAPVDPMDSLREKLAAKLGAAKAPEARTPYVVRVVSKAESASHAPASHAKPVAARTHEVAANSNAHTAALVAALRAEKAAEGHGTIPGHAAHWSYAGDGGPETWGRLKPEFAKCSTGTRQSPIDIRGGISVDLEPIQFDYRSTGFNVVDNGHTIQVNLGPGNAIEVMGRRYDLVQFHFHRPSEERINGKQFEMVAHLVHKDTEGKLAVVAVLLERGPAQGLVQTVWNNLPLEKNDEVSARVPMDLNELLPKDRRYFTYMGSLTTPPCSEGVLWMVMQQPVTVAPEQIAVFSRLYPMNARPIQSAAGRLIKQSN